jgi:DNA modification methylase
MTDWQVIHGSAEDILPGLELCDALVTDPPYGIGEAAGANKSRGKAAIAKDYGSDDWDNAPPSDALIALARSRARRSVIFGGNYFTLPPSRCWLVWDKLNGTNDFADCELAWTNLDMAVRRLAYRWNGMIRENGEPRGIHPTQKPVGVMQWVLSLCTKPGDLVLDPFCGSGTTGVACLRMGRRFIGIEREKKYADAASKRLAAEAVQSTYEDAQKGQASLFGP